MRARKMRIQEGFTLLEAIVTLAILAIITGLAAPSFNRTLQSNRAAVLSNELIGALQLSRSEALKRRTDVTLCRRNSAGNNCENGTDWAVGWLLIQGSIVIRVWEPVTGAVLTGIEAGVTFHSSGLTTLAETQTFTIQTPSCRRTVSINLTGSAFANQTGCLSS